MRLIGEIGSTKHLGRMGFGYTANESCPMHCCDDVVSGFEDWQQTTAFTTEWRLVIGLDVPSWALQYSLPIGIDLTNRTTTQGTAFKTDLQMVSSMCKAVYSVISAPPLACRLTHDNIRVIRSPGFKVSHPG